MSSVYQGLLKTLGTRLQTQNNIMTSNMGQIYLHHLIVNPTFLQLKWPKLTATTISKRTSWRLSITDAPSVAFPAQIWHITHRLAHRTRCAVGYIDDSNPVYKIGRFTLANTTHTLTNREQRT